MAAPGDYTTGAAMAPLIINQKKTHRRFPQWVFYLEPVRLLTSEYLRGAKRSQ